MITHQEALELYPTSLSHLPSNTPFEIRFRGSFALTDEPDIERNARLR